MLLRHSARQVACSGCPAASRTAGPPCSWRPGPPEPLEQVLAAGDGARPRPVEHPGQGRQVAYLVGVSRYAPDHGRRRARDGRGGRRPASVKARPAAPSPARSPSACPPIAAARTAPDRPGATLVAQQWAGQPEPRCCDRRPGSRWRAGNSGLGSASRAAVARSPSGRARSCHSPPTMRSAGRYLPLSSLIHCSYSASSALPYRHLALGWVSPRP